ncbi:MAG: bifunctional molybdenum cofactor biosynthesis protein MoaC/MoaB [Calditrichaeota bacterium]|nr:bifunctional molybdenum cofactor biosynthesis protein MoaC/MoaB [Calditrichota bacterium]
MIDISSKFNTLRFAQAQGILKTDSTIIQSISEKKESLDNIFEIARAAAINAAKRSAEWIILGHANPIDWIAVNFELKTNTIIVNAEVKAVWKNGIELEAMAAVSAALLNLFQIISPLDQNVTISDVKIIKRKGGQEQFNDEFEKPLKTAILVISDSTFEGRRTDKSGKVIQEMLDDKSFQVAVYEVLPDNKMQISDRLKSLADDEDFDLVLTTGGTGFGPKDVTPEATLDILEKQSPGITESMRRFGKDRTPYAMLSREVAGIRGTTVIINLPGSSKGAAECMDALFPGLLHAFPMLWGGGHDEKKRWIKPKSNE